MVTPTTLTRRRLLLVAVGAVVLILVAVAATWFVRSSVPVESANGVGDPYYPGSGGSGYDALAYRVDVDWDEGTRELRGTTEIRLRPDAALSTIRLDLDLTVDSATLDGRPVQVAAGEGTDRIFRPEEPLRAGREAVLVVAYHGSPENLEVRSTRVAQSAGRELVVSGEPISAPAWFPANDHPSDPATFDVTVTVPQDLQVISIGRLVSRDADQDPNTATWRWASDRPTVTYATMLAIGQFEIEQGDVDGRPYVYAVSRQLSSDEQQEAMAALRATPERIRELEGLYGPYPVDAAGGLVTAMEASYVALETLGRPTYGRQLVEEDAREQQTLLTHELAHMWFGNQVTLAGWDDIVLNEGFATHAEWLVAEDESGGANRILNDAWEDERDRFWTSPIDDPGHRNMFGTTYTRGAMALQALSNVLGEEAFGELAREWASQQGPRSFEDFRAMAERRAGRTLGTFWQAWYAGDEAPPQTSEYGWVD